MTSPNALFDAKLATARFLHSQGHLLAAATIYEELGYTDLADGMVMLWEERRDIERKARAQIRRELTSLTRIFQGR